MGKGRPNSLVAFLRSRAQLAGAGASDGQLLERFLAQREEAAFAALVQRHGPMVWGVCRRVLGEADAEDAFQATFLVLAKKAAAVARRDLLGNWLYGVAWRTAREAKTAALRRQAKERLASARRSPTAPPEADGELRALLDQELSRLPDRYRAPIVLCDLEGNSRREAAQLLRLPEGTLSSRLARGRRMLAQRLGRHAPGISCAAVARVLAESGAAVPPPLLVSTVEAARLVATGSAAAGLISTEATMLMEGALKSMFMTKLARLAALLLLVAVLAAGIGVALSASGATAPPALASAPAPPKAAERPELVAGRQGRGEAAGDVWALDFRFKGPRLRQVDVPGDGKKTVLYLLYDLVNRTGKPRTTILSFDLVVAGKNTVHPDRVMPGAQAVIQQFEDPQGLVKLESSATIAARPVPPSRPAGPARVVPGVALWENVVPKEARFTVFVSGLTNAWSVSEPLPPDTEPVFRRKMLQLEFAWKGVEVVFVPPAKWVYRKAPFRIRPAGRQKPKAGLDEDRREDRAIIAALEEQRAPLEVEEAERKIDLEIVSLRLRALRQAVEEERPTGIEADRARERLNSLEQRERHLRTKDRDKQIYFQLLNRRLRELRKTAGADEAGPGEKNTDSAVRARAVRALLGVMKHDSDKAARAAAADALRGMGRVAVPALCAALEDGEEVRYHAARVLGSIVTGE
jgi:RNA polymerase sigma factor (sigma-70 family)